MGNNNSASKLCQILESSEQDSKSCEHIIIQHIQTECKNNDIESIDQRRIVFVSLNGVYNSWKKLPSVSCLTCLLLLPLKRKWICYPSQCRDEIKTSLLSQIDCSDAAETKKFFEFLKWKDSQDLVFWMLDSYKHSNYSTQNKFIHAFWYFLSDKLTHLYDPITGNKYAPLILDDWWWKRASNFNSKFDTETPAILIELCFMSMKFKPIQEIIYQSNPNSLYPIINYIDNKQNSFSHWAIENDSDTETWFISDQYQQNV